MELFDKKFVHFMWDDELNGKKCFVSDNIAALKAFVELGKSNVLLEVAEGDGNYPFAVHWTDDRLSTKYRFAYYDPNYDAKRAFNEGKKVQHLDGLWVDDDEPTWIEGLEYRIKPEEAVVTKKCGSCVHEHCSAINEPCVSCKPGNSKYEARLCETLRVAKKMSNESLREKNRDLRERISEAKDIIFDLVVALRNIVPNLSASSEEIKRAEKFLEEEV